MPPGPPHLRRVHIDHVAPDKKDRYEAARRDWLAALAAKKLSEDPTWIVELPGPVYWIVHPFATWSDLDAQKIRARVLDDAAGAAAVTRYDAATHPCLVAPHHNEIWRRLIYLSDGGALDETSAKTARLEIDQVSPPEGDAWQAAQVELRKALAAAGYPLTRITYESSYGTGRYLTFWLAPDRAALAAAPSVEEALTKAIGPDAAAKLLAKIHTGLVEHTEQEAIFRPDLVR